MDEGKGGHPVFKSNADKENWSACYHVLKEFSEGEMEMISYIYRPGETLADKIYLLSKSKQMPQDTIWSLINNIERRIAKKRGLL
jgi:hypothetical protein